MDINNIFHNNEYIDFYNSIESDDKCMICLTNYNLYNKVTLECNHIYHNSCINLLLKNTHYFICPYCKLYQDKFNLSKICKYVTKNGKKCNKMCLTDSNICIFHNKYMTNNICLGIYKYGKNKGKRCLYKPINGKFFCKIHNKLIKKDKQD